MGRFTLRDEGKTIAVGRVLKYKPIKVGIAPTVSIENKEEKKADGTTGTNGDSAIDTASSADQKKVDLVFDMETGETISQEEYERRKKEREA